MSINIERLKNLAFLRARTIKFMIGIALLGLVVLLFIPSSTKDSMHVQADSIEFVPSHFADESPVAMSGDIPEVNNNREIERTSDLRIWYRYISGEYNPVFQSDLSPEILDDGIKISPKLHGKWRAPFDDTLVFTPTQEPTPETTYQIKIDKKLFGKNVIPDTRTISFRTAAIKADIETFNVYPTTDKSVIGVAIISFNYPIQTTNLAEKVSVLLGGKRIAFDVTVDRFARTLQIKTKPIQITNKPQVLRLKLNRVRAAMGKSRTKKITANTTIQSQDNFFRVVGLDTIVADDSYGNPQQLLLINTTAPIAKNTNLGKYITPYLLPLYKTEEEEKDQTPHEWARDEVTPEILSKAKNFEITPVNFVSPTGVYQRAFSYNISDKVARYVYVAIKPQIPSTIGLNTKDGVAKVMPVPYPMRSVKIAGKGVLLSLAGDKELGIVARGGADTAFVTLYKIESREINHLITQTYELFDQVRFSSPWNFNAYDMSVVFQKKIPFSNSSLNQINYASVNLGEYTDRTYSDQTGIFIIKTAATDISDETSFNYDDARLILLTNLGIIRKINFDRSSSVFVSRLSDGSPASDVDVTVLARNGRPIWAGVTNSGGVVEIPNLPASEYKNDREPVAIVAKTESDVSFIPFYDNEKKHSVDYSKFDISGTHYANLTPLNAYVFSDRGIYRPGETVTIGAIVENKNFTAVDEMPMQITITNPRGHTIFERRVSSGADGLIDLAYKTTNDAVVGRYDVSIHLLNKRGHIQETIGNGTFTVQEFVPDTMKIVATIHNAKTNGWMKTNELGINASLNNMYGTPATDRRISGTAILRPLDFTFDNYKDYKFAPNFNGKTTSGIVQNIQTFTAQIADTRTDENGNAVLKVEFADEIPMGTYSLHTQVNGFEAGDGKSIQTIVNTRVSNFDYLVGYKTNSDLNYINRDATASLKFIALDNSGNPTSAKNLGVRLIKRENLTSLIKDYDDNYKYQTVTRDIVVSQSKMSISENGATMDLNTQNGGTYFLEISDEQNNVLANIEYFVASDQNAEMQHETKADLHIKLDATDYKPGATINISITSPYVGSGLITIERDRVYAYKWFFTQNTSSIQTITLPENFEGTGYVNVSFVRDINSKDIFTTPYTYAVAPFSTSIDKHKINVELKTPSVIKDNKLNIEYTTDKDARVMLFAVNTGILQVANYKIPNPLTYFFQKAALQVETYQILSLLMPEYKILRQFAKTGGSDYSPDSGAFDIPLTNPFGRKQLPSVAFYSGILNAKAGESNSVSFDIPEYFNGSLSVYAVAAAPGAMGAAHDETRVQSPVIISLSSPTFVAPNDKFRVNAIVSNMAQDSGDQASAHNNAFTSDNLEISSEKSGIIDLAENTEKLWSFDLVATDKLGNANVGVATSLMDTKNNIIATRQSNATLSVRPASSLTTEIKMGKIKRSSATIKIPKNEMYPEQLSQTLYISKRPTVMAYPMFEYLKNYDYTCTEQLVSRTLPFVLMPEDKIMGTTRADSTAKVAEAIQALTGRQNDDGSFGLWSGAASFTETSGDASTAYLTAYTMNFLSLARQFGFTVPQSMYSRGIDFLRSYAGDNTTSAADALAKSFAIYVLSANDYVTTSYIDMLTEYLNTNVSKWESGIIGSYLAASYKMLKQNDKANNLFAKYKGTTNNLLVYDDAVANDAMHTHIGVRYFAKSITSPSKKIQEYMDSGDYGSFNAANIVLAFAGGKGGNDNKIAELSLSTKGGKTMLDQGADTFVATISPDSKQVNFDCPYCKKEPLFYTFIRQGFPRTTKSQYDGIDITRTYYDINGNEVHGGNIGDFIDVKITARTRGGTDTIANAVITDLLPGALIPISDTLSGDMDFSEIREDRVLIYASLSHTPITITYRAQLAVSGEFTVPAISASDMYNPRIRAVGKTGKMTVSNAAN